MPDNLLYYGDNTTATTSTFCGTASPPRAWTGLPRRSTTPRSFQAGGARAAGAGHYLC